MDRARNLAYWATNVFLVTIGMVSISACGPNCEFDQRCDGNVLETCSVGVDQIVGDPEYDRMECAGSTPVCVELSDVSAVCAPSETESCEPDTCMEAVLD